MPQTLNIRADFSERAWSVAQIASDLGIDASNLRQRYLNPLMAEGHKLLRGYEGGPLTEQQKDLVVEFRRLKAEVRLRGARALDRIADYPYKQTELKTVIGEICDHHGVEAHKREALVNDIVRAINEG